MGKIDFTFPLPNKNLHERYDEVFNTIKRGHDPMITGLPQSSRSAFLKFIIEYDNKFLDEFIDSRKYQFIQIESKDVSDNRYISSIAYEIFEDRIVKTEDPLLITAAIKNYLKKNKLKRRLVFVIYELETFLIKNSETYKFICELLKINKHNSKGNGFQAIFICSPRDINKTLADRIIQFNLFNEDELKYTKKRLEFFRDKKIDNKIHDLATKLSFGHYLLYKFLTDLNLDELNQVSKLKTHTSIRELLDTIWKGTGNIEIINNFLPISIPILLPPVSRFTKENEYSDIVQLTSQERTLFDGLKTKNEIFNRDQVAQIIWGTNWTNKYSDWAIDKLVSKLKSKLVYSKYEILTIRGRGYQLKNNVD